MRAVAQYDAMRATRSLEEKRSIRSKSFGTYFYDEPSPYFLEGYHIVEGVRRGFAIW
jgi:hypothetical protein